MILQCEQCNTKFRLDDSKLKPGGVKVRCSKCRHVFIAGAEQPQEETDFDALLSGLGASAPQAPPAPEPEPPVSAAAPPFAVEEAAKREEPAAEEEEEEAPAGDFSLEAPAASTDEPETAPRHYPGVSEFSFDEETPAAAEEPSREPEDRFTSADEFAFEGDLPQESPERATPAGEAAPFGEFTFDLSAPAAQEVPSSPAVGGFAEFSFDSEPSPQEEENEVQAESETTFGELSFDAEPAAAAAAPAQTSELEFGELAFDTEPAAEPVSKVETVRPTEFSFDDFAFEGDEAPAPAAATAAPASAPSEFSFGDFSFDSEPEPEPAADSEVSFGADEAQPGKAAPVADGEFGFGEFSFGGAEEEGEEPAAPEQKKSSFSFSEDLLAGSTIAASSEGTSPAAGLAAAEVEPEESAAPAHQGTHLFGADTHPSGFDAEQLSSGVDRPFGATFAAHELDEEPPPLTIPSRRKGRSVASLTAVLGSLLVLAALCGGGVYLMKNDPAALDKVGLGFLGQMLGIEGSEEGRIVIDHPLAAFYQNKEAGELFVVTGEAENQFRKPRASIQVKVTLFDKSGKKLMQKTAYCGNRLSEVQLATLPLIKLDAAMNNQFGDSLSNLGVKPGQKIPFVVAIANVPKEAADFGVEVSGSTVAAP